MRLRNEKILDFYSSTNVAGVIKSGRIRWTGHVASKGRREFHTGFRLGKTEENIDLEELGVDGRILK